ncbi:DNA helicase [Clostridia bacterium]|nr:DNA helicase [Clostridia bacterium]
MVFMVLLAPGLGSRGILYFMIDLSHLNEKQREAALHGDGPLLILAGAGSGKTSVMTHRIARLILDEGVNPRQILAVTFTNKAAAEMRERVARLLYGKEAMAEDGEAILGRLSGYGGIWLLTFHAACLRILHDHADRLGYTKGFTVYDPQDQKAVVRRCVKALELDPKKYSPAYVLAAISDFKEHGKTPSDALAEASGVYAGPRRRDVAELYKSYAKILKDGNAMDFDDLLLNAVRLFQQNEDVLGEYRRRFRYLMVDEYQDTNRLQYLFVKLLAEKTGNLVVVGDDDQSIYGWRGADIRNILDFEKDFPGAKVVKLEQNYRSCGHILNCANSVIKENRGRKDKALWTDRGAGDKVFYKLVYDEKDEARYVASEIFRLHGAGRRYSDMAVLSRTNAQSRVFEEAFIVRGIEYRMLGQVRYYDRKEIKDMLSYMVLVANPGDSIAFARAVNEPARGIGEKSLAAIMTGAAQRGMTPLELLSSDEASKVLSGKARAAAVDFAVMLTSFSGVYEQMKVSELYDALLEKSGYMKALEVKDTPEDDARIENLLEFRTAIAESEAEAEAAGLALTLSAFLEKIALMSDIDNHDRNADAVVCMTMHSAKGLEFPVVFLPGMEEGLFPTSRSLEQEDGIEEERRLCYVGMTRAMDRLYLLRAKQRMLYGKRNYTIESRFLAEIDPAVLDESGDQPGKDLSGYVHEDLSGGWGKARPAFGSVHEGGEGARRPVDLFREAQADVHTKTRKVSPDVQSGDRVRHAKFGPGLVIEVTKGVATVMFDESGRKKLALDVAPLEKIG